MLRLRKTAVLVGGTIVLLTAQACTPEELTAVEQATGIELGTVEEVNTGCIEAFGAGSETQGGACWQIGVDMINRSGSTVQESSNTQDSSSESEDQEETDTPSDGSYRSFSDCLSAVDYLFAGRNDHERARRVVRRESGNRPNAVSPTGAKGCTQITSGIRNRFLGGPWSDPYWNVLAMRRAVDHSDYGWCHWDIVNYCNAGGEF